MGHNLCAIVARPELLRDFAIAHGAIVVPLEQGFAMIPATTLVLDRIGLGPPREGFGHCNAALSAALSSLSRTGAAAYIETHYWAGHGAQLGIAWRAGESVVEEPEQPRAAINAALAAIGVRRSDSHDEFDSLGLARFRRMDDWEEADDR